MNNNVSPGIVEVAPFVGDTGAVPCAVGSNACQKDKWYNKLYAANPANSTPLREVLSRVGQYYAHKFGNVTTYKATITVSGSGATTIDDITVNGVSIMDDTSLSATTSNQVAQNIANQINAMQVTDFGASVSGSVITITGPASASGVDAGHRRQIRPRGHEHQRHRVHQHHHHRAAERHYARGPDAVFLPAELHHAFHRRLLERPQHLQPDNSPVGQQDGSAPRPFDDGAQAHDHLYQYVYATTTYGRTSGSGTCSIAARPETVTPQTGTCTTTVPAAAARRPHWVKRHDDHALLPQVCISIGIDSADPAPRADGHGNDPGSRRRTFRHPGRRRPCTTTRPTCARPRWATAPARSAPACAKTTCSSAATTTTCSST